MKFLKKLMGRVTEVDINDSRYQPDQDMKEGETEIGVMSEPLRRVYAALCTYREHLNSEAARLDREIPAGLLKKDATSAQLEQVRKYEQDKADYKLAAKVFWHEADLEFPQPEDADGSRAVRKGWKLVSIEDEGPGIILVPMPLGLGFGLGLGGL